jgi:hypothetical protein
VTLWKKGRRTILLGPTAGLYETIADYDCISVRSEKSVIRNRNDIVLHTVTNQL